MIIFSLSFLDCSSKKENRSNQETEIGETFSKQSEKKLPKENQFSGERKEAVDTVRRNILSDKATILLPQDFEIMDQKMLAFKYPNTGNRPTVVYTNAEASVNIAFNHTSTPVKPFELSNLKGPIVQQIRNTPGVEVFEEGVRTIKGREFIVLKFFSQAIDTKVYNYMFATSLSNRLLVGTFNCTNEEFHIWEDKSEVIVNSLEIQ